MTRKDLIIESVELFTSVSLEKMRTRTRKGTVVDARRMLTGIWYDTDEVTYQDIADELHNPDGLWCDHVLAMHYKRTDGQLVKHNARYRAVRDCVFDRVNRLYVPPPPAQPKSPRQLWDKKWRGIVLSPCVQSAKQAAA